jgi:hypothetical protein
MAGCGQTSGDISEFEASGRDAIPSNPDWGLWIRRLMEPTTFVVFCDALSSFVGIEEKCRKWSAGYANCALAGP